MTTLRTPRESALLRACIGRLIQTEQAPELFRALFITAREIAPEGLARLIDSSEEPLLASGVLEDDASAWWQSQDAADILGLLMDVLHAVAPEGHYFGEKADDPTDYGFWPVLPEHAACPNPRWRTAGKHPE